MITQCNGGGSQVIMQCNGGGAEVLHNAMEGGGGGTSDHIYIISC